MLQGLPKQLQRPSSDFAGLMSRWGAAIGLAITVGLAYFLASLLSLALLTKPDGVAVFWPAAGVAAGILIALGPRARLPVAAGAMAATILANLLGDRSIWGAIVFALCNAGEALLVAGLIERYFGPAFSLDGLRQVLGLLAATVVATTVSGIGGTMGYVWFHSSTAPVLTIWHHWVTSDALGIITVAPLLIGLLSSVRDPPLGAEFIEGFVALVALTLLSGLIIFLPQATWIIVALIALLFPLLLWLAARCRPVFAAAGAFVVSLTIVWTTTFSIGIFADPNFPVAGRILTAQAAIAAVSLCAFVLAALFSERRESEARLARSNVMLQRERDNKLMNLEAMAASISHEVRQPLAAISVNSAAAARFLGHAPPNLAEVRMALERIGAASRRADEVFDNIRALFGSADQRQELVDVNEMVLGALGALHGELDDAAVTARTELAPDLPLVIGHKGQLQEVIHNLARNAIEAMNAVKGGNRVLRVKTGRHGGDAIAVAVEDSGPGIDQQKLDGIFDAFVTTKPKGMGLGLAICRMIIDRHGGQLTASSDGKAGAVFQFVLPIEPVAGSATASP